MIIFMSTNDKLIECSRREACLTICFQKVLWINEKKKTPKTEKTDQKPKKNARFLRNLI